MKYEIRAMSFSEILDTGFQLLRNHFQLLLGLSLVIYAPIAVLTIVIDAAKGDAMQPGVALLALVPLVLAILVAAPIVSAAITYAVGQLYLGEPVDFGSSMQTAMSMILPLVGTSFLSTIVIAVGFVLFIIPGFYFILAFILLWQVMVLERVFGTAALRRSHELMKGNKMRAIGILTVGGIIVGVLAFGLGVVFGFIPLLGSIGSAVAQAIGGAYTTAISVVLYFDIRCRKEAFDLEHLAQLVQGAGRGSAISPEPLVR